MTLSKAFGTLKLIDFHEKTTFFENHNLDTF